MVVPSFFAHFLRFACLFTAVPCLCSGEPAEKQRPTCKAGGLTVDLGYEIYRGYDAGNGVNAWTKVRFAAPPIGALRWQLPKAPATNRSKVIKANANPRSFKCPQTQKSPPIADNCGHGEPRKSNAPPCVQAFYDEDCLFLNVYAPHKAKNLPVLVWIHGGGYGLGEADADGVSLISANGRSFVFVAIQYRLGAFGFLSSPIVQRHGVSNAGLHDQQFALKWVQKHICRFGGDPSRVTIFGESAGGGSVIAHISAMNGSLKTTYFRNTIAASPYLPKPVSYKDRRSTDLFKAFAREAGCHDTATAFHCLQKTHSDHLQVASNRVSTSGLYGTWAFLPVIDGKFLVRNPVDQIASGKINGERTLSGNVANEGTVFVPRNITTYRDFASFAQRSFPDVSFSKILENYPSSELPTDPLLERLFATAGNHGPTAINQSSVATGQLQRAINLYSESTFVCPSYWLADAFAKSGKASYKYQFSVPYATHMSDLSSYFGPLPVPRYINTDFQLAVMQMIGNFTVHNDPSISNQAANGQSRSDVAPNPASSWPQWTMKHKHMMDLNTTHGTRARAVLAQPYYVVVGVPIHVSPGLRNHFTVADAATWEGGRGRRCDFWQREYAR